MPGRIPQEFINDLIDRCDIVEVIGGRINLKKAGREYKACCPFHGEKTASFTVSPDKGFYHCFGCGAHGTAIGFLMEHDQLEFIDAVEELASINGVEVPREAGNSTPGDPVAPLHQLLDKAAEAFAHQLRESPETIVYLKKRGLDGETVARYRIGYAPSGWDYLIKLCGGSDNDRDHLLKAGLVIRNDKGRVYDRFRDRVMFPIRDSRGRTIAFGGRVTDQGEPKYLNSPETPVFHKGRELYGWYEARQANRRLEQVIVVEGYMDVVALACHGISNAVATLGTATTPEHLKRIFRGCSEIIFCFDGDRAGREAAWRALNVSLPELRDGRRIEFLFLEEGQDPDSVVTEGGAEAFQNLLENSVPLSDYLLQHLKAATDVESMDGLARLAELARPLVNQIPAGIYRELLLGKLANEVGLSPERLGELIEDASSPAAAATPSQRRSMPKMGVTAGRSGNVRQAIRLVLHKPAIAREITIPAELSGIQRKGIQLLGQLLTEATTSPDIKPARLAEQLTEHPDGGQALVTLLAQDIPLDDSSNWQEQLQATLRAICREELEKRFATLTEKADQSLNAEEKQEFRELQLQLAENRAGSN
jgi:DNA primase